MSEHNLSEVTEVLQKLLQIKSPYFEEEDIMHYVQNWFEKNNIPCTRHEYHEQKVTGFKGINVICELDSGLPGPAIHINGHLDTVQLCSGWTKDPYGGVIEGDRIYGVGAVDMKGGCAANMVAIKRFKESGVPFRGKIVASFVSVEEGPFGLGSNALIEDGKLGKIDLTIVTEPTGGLSGPEHPLICLGAKGGYGGTIELFGKSAHAARPEGGISAAVDAAKVVCELEKVRGKNDPFLGEGKLCVIKIDSDGGACSVPDYAKIVIFRHIVPGETQDTIRAEIEEAIQKANIRSAHKFSFRDAPSPESEGFMPYRTDENEPYVLQMEETIAEVTGKKAQHIYFSSIGDFNYFGTRVNAPCIVFGTSGEGGHSSDEYTTISSTEKLVDVLVAFLEKALKP